MPQHEPISLVPLLTATARGDVQGFRKLFFASAPKLLAFFASRGLPFPVAEEMLQNTMVSIWQRAPEFDPGKHDAYVWIFGIARDHAMRALYAQLRRTDAAQYVAEKTPEAPDIEAAFDQADIMARLRPALEALPDKHKSLLVDVFWGGLSHSQIARRRQMQVGTVKSMLRRTLIWLRAAAKAHR